MSNTEYSEEFKNNILKKVFTPNQGKTIKMISEETGVPYSTFMRWKKGASTESMSRSKSKKDLSAEEKFEIFKKESKIKDLDSL